MKQYADTDYFHLGMLAALTVVHQADLGTLYDEIVRAADVDALVRIAEIDEQLEMSGLTARGYGRQPCAAPRRPRH